MTETPSGVATLWAKLSRLRVAPFKSEGFAPFFKAELKRCTILRQPAARTVNVSGSTLKRTLLGALPSPVSSTSEAKRGRRWFPCSAIPKKFDHSSTNHPTNMPPKYLDTYELINNGRRVRRFKITDLPR
jgi:hypothetical protein